MAINTSSVKTGPLAASANGADGRLLIWLPIIAGLAVLYVPTLIDLLSGIWSSDEQKHGPIVLAIACWLAWRKWPAMWQASDAQPTSAAGWPIFVFGLLLYAIGRSQDILLFEVGSLIWLLSAIVLLTRGVAALKAQWFALFFMLFMIPLPG
ncbi:MAG: archaeosortase/exosortase family protein, partial [Candidatus Accumulibacter sp.]|nr:archaeosortase/exosortase family protein [Accumulibacter sp.]